MTRNTAGWVLCLTLVFPGMLKAQTVPPEWAYSQEVLASGKGPTRVGLSPEALSNAQPDLSDLRLLNGSGQELSFFVDRPRVEPALVASPDHMNIVMEKGRTVITGEAPQSLLSRGFDAIDLFTPTNDFLKPVTLEVSADKRHWKTLVRSYPIFNQPGRMQSIGVEFPKISLPFLRITLDDTASAPLRISAVRLYSAPKKIALQTIYPKILETTYDAHQTLLRLQLPAAHLTVDSIRIDTPQTSFKRTVSVGTKIYVNGDFRENALGADSIYRVPLADRVAERLYIPVGAQAPTRELILRIENGDNLPLDIRRIQVALIPAVLVFDVPVPGKFTLLLGNPSAAAKYYDVSAFRDQLSRGSLKNAGLGPLVKNPAFKPSDRLPQISETGSAIDVSAWKYRKKIALSEAGLQRLEIDPQTLAHNEGRVADLRLVRNGQQLPYILDSLGVSRQIELRIESQSNSDKKTQWIVALPLRGLPITSLKFSVQEPLFQRSMALYEDSPDERGDKIRTSLGWANWTRTHGSGKEEFSLLLNRPPTSDRLILETDNGDNPPIHVAGARGFYQAPRIFFKAGPGSELYLYYGQPKADRPQYDVSLIAGEVLSVEPAEARLTQEEVFKITPWWELPIPSTGMKVLFWATLGLVMAGLLYAIAKLLPAETQV